VGSAFTVRYSGILPDLFREGQGVIVQGKLDDAGVFNASQVLAKHDENYMPPELAELSEGHQKKPNLLNYGSEK
jgi:cytochrome c-type biogenesis protein CcmE